MPPAFVSWDLCVDTAQKVAERLLEEKSPWYDEADIAKDAATCMMVGNSSFSLIGEELYRAISPRLEQDPGVTENSKIPELKAKLKAWGLPVSGTKAQLWERVADEVTPCHDSLCLCTKATKARVAVINDLRFSKSKAMEMFHLDRSCWDNLPTETVLNQRVGMYLTYSIRDIKRIARAKRPQWGAYRRQQQLTASYKESAARHEEEAKANTARLIDMLMARGFREPEIKSSMGHFWHLEYTTLRGISSDKEERFRVKVEALHTYLWYCNNTQFRQIDQTSRSNFKYRSGSKYRQDYNRELSCYAPAMERWVSTHATLNQALAAAPDHLHDHVRAAWTKVSKAGAAAGGVGGAGPSGVAAGAAGPSGVAAAGAAGPSGAAAGAAGPSGVA